MGNFKSSTKIALDQPSSLYSTELLMRLNLLYSIGVECYIIYILEVEVGADSIRAVV